MNETYTITDLSVMTGLNVRTIRRYLAAGQLEGTKENGTWRFTPEQFEKFLRQDMVRQSVQAKANGIVFDFLLAERKERAACLICSWPAEGEAEQVLREKLLEQVNERELKLFYRFENGLAKAVITGGPEKMGGLLENLPQ